MPRSHAGARIIAARMFATAAIQRRNANGATP
jgi:hypothetical protein